MTPQQRGLLHKSEQSLQAASLLKEQGFADISVSRAYYAMFYVAEAILEGEGLSFSSHSAVISALGERFARTERIPRKFHRHLIDAQDQRIRADYNIDANLSSDDADRLIDWAEKFLQFALSNIDSLSCQAGS